MTPRKKSKFQIFQSMDGRWAWQLLAGNGTVRAVSPDTYGFKSNCKRAVIHLRASMKHVERVIEEVDLIDGLKA